MSIEFNGKVLDTDEEGYISNLSQWEPGVAEVMAKDDDCDLTQPHWRSSISCASITRSIRLRRPCGC